MVSAGVDIVTIRPVKIRRVCWILAPVVVVFFVIIGVLLSGTVGQQGGVFQASDQVAMGVMGLLAAGGILLFTRPKVVLSPEGIAIRNVIGGYNLPWSVVSDVKFGKGSPWATLELADGDIVAMMAIQATDKEHAVEAIRTVRAHFTAATP